MICCTIVILACPESFLLSSSVQVLVKKDSRQAGMTKINQDSGPILVKAKISARMTFLEHVLPVLIELAWWRNRWN
jgi:hypothetical protein